MVDVNRFVEQLIGTAVQKRAADIYLVARTKEYRVRMHLALQVLQYDSICHELATKVINYFKYHGNMLISEHRRPQAGAMEWRTQATRCYLRLSTVGDFHGHESLVIRLIYPLKNESLGMANDLDWQRLIGWGNHHGLIAFAGPTGSGKTTSIYQLARQFSAERMVMSIEDPVEVDEPSFLQLQVNLDAGIGYPELLKVALRSHPDILIIGEIRDLNTAQAAVQAALSGHLVLTTLHARGPLEIIDRLTNLGLDGSYLEQCLVGVVYQRLIMSETGTLLAHLSALDHGQVYDTKVSQATARRAWQARLTALALKGVINDEERRRVWNG